MDPSQNSRPADPQQNVVTGQALAQPIPAASVQPSASAPLTPASQYDLNSFGNIKLAGYLTIPISLLHVIVGFLGLSGDYPLLAFLILIAGAVVGVVGVNFISARTVGDFLLWSKVFVFTVLTTFVGSLIITRELSGIGLLPLIVLFIIQSAMGKIYSAGLATSRSLLIAKPKG